VGKSVARLVTPAEGRIVLNGQGISRLPARRLRSVWPNIG
jgi:peptide/nickel transport system ATP-binding protein